MKNYIVLLLMFCLNSGFAQVFNWAKIMNSGLMNCSTADKYGNVYITGSFNNTIDLDPSANSYSLAANNVINDIFVAKYRNNGDFIWGFRIGGPNNDVGKKIAVDKHGNVFVMGTFMGLVDFNPGNGTDTLRAPTASIDIFIAKYDSMGNYQWVNQITKQSVGANNHPACTEMHIDDNNDIILTGVSDGGLYLSNGSAFIPLNQSLTNDILFAKYQNNGALSWANTIGGSSWDYSGCIGTDSLNNIYLTGRYEYDIDLDPGANTAILTHTNVLNAQNIFLAKYTPAGVYIWGKTILSPNTYSATALDNALFVEKNGNAYLTGQIVQGSLDFDPGSPNVFVSGYYDCFFSKYDYNGNYVWVYKIGAGYGDEGKDISLDSLGNIYILGNFTGTVDFNPAAAVSNMTSTAFTDLFFAKYTPSGGFLMSKHLATSASRNLSLDNLNNIYIAGNFNTTSTVDFDPGTSTYNLSGNSTTLFIAKYGTSITTDIKEGLLEMNEISVFPNPVSHVLHSNTNSSYKIFDVLGNLCTSGNSSQTIPIDFLNTGVYFIELEQSNQSKKLKFIKE